MPSKHFLTANNKLLEKKTFLWLKAKSKAKLKPELKERFSEIPVSKDALLDIKLFRSRAPLLL